MKKISRDDFIIRETKTGHSIYWAVSQAFIKFFQGSDSRSRAHMFIGSLISWYDYEGWQIDTKGRVSRG